MTIIHVMLLILGIVYFLPHSLCQPALAPAATVFMYVICSLCTIKSVNILLAALKVDVTIATILLALWLC